MSNFEEYGTPKLTPMSTAIIVGISAVTLLIFILTLSSSKGDSRRTMEYSLSSIEAVKVLANSKTDPEYVKNLAGGNVLIAYESDHTPKYVVGFDFKKKHELNVIVSRDGKFSLEHRLYNELLGETSTSDIKIYAKYLKDFDQVEKDHISKK